MLIKTARQAYSAKLTNVLHFSQVYFIFNSFNLSICIVNSFFCFTITCGTVHRINLKVASIKKARIIYLALITIFNHLLIIL